MADETKPVFQKRILRSLIILALLITNVSCDQISKNMVREHIRYNQHIRLLDNYLTLTKVENTGAFLSMGRSLPRSINILLLIVLPLVVLISALIFLFSKSHLSVYKIVGISLIIGGGLGNLYDRAFHGSVTDFLHIDFVLFQTGIFNLADFSIMIGLFILLYEEFSARIKLRLKTSQE